MKAGLFLLGVAVGTLFGFSLAAWALYEPIHGGPAKYSFTRSAGPVPPYTMDGTRKLFRVECISESEKDCPPPTLAVVATPIPEPGTAALLLIGLAGLMIKSR